MPNQLLTWDDPLYHEVRQGRGTKELINQAIQLGMTTTQAWAAGDDELVTYIARQTGKLKNSSQKDR